MNFFEYEKVRDGRGGRRDRAQGAGGGSRWAAYLSFVFENRDTVLFQIQEMCRAERIVDDARVQEEIDVYNALLPRPGELSATMFIEIEDKARSSPCWTASWASTTASACGCRSGAGERGARRLRGRALRRGEGQARAVHFVRFPLPARGPARAFRGPACTWWWTTPPTGRGPSLSGGDRRSCAGTWSSGRRAGRRAAGRAAACSWSPLQRWSCGLAGALRPLARPASSRAAPVACDAAAGPARASQV